MGSRATLTFFQFVSICALLCVSSQAFARDVCSETHVLIRGAFGEARFRVDVADDPQERAQGLMHVASMPRSVGMLFVYERPQTASFWMKNTLIPLDMIFTDRSGTITHIHQNAVPHDETPIPGGSEVYGVLEINGGLSEMFGIQVGDSLLHEAFLDDAARINCKE